MVTTNTGAGSSQTALYPNQFFSLSQFYIPENTKSLFRWYSYFFYKDPIIGQCVTKMASFPITEFVYKVEGDDNKMKERWKDLLEDQLNVKSLLVELGLDYFVYGNAFLSINIGFTRYLLCPHCKRLMDITNNENLDDQWTYKPVGKEVQFEMTCNKCGQTGTSLSVIDKVSNNPKDINFIRWDPQQIDIEYYPITGKSKYYYAIPAATKKKVQNGKDKYLIKTMPKAYLQAIQLEHMVELDRTNVYHFKRTTLAEKDQGWGKSLIIHSLQRLYYLFTLRRAQEAIATGHITPMDFVYPVEQGGVSPHMDVNLPLWMEKTREEFKQHRRDPNYIAVLPIPINAGRIGGDGKMLMLGPEIDAGNKEVAAGMGVPLEFLFGGLSWSGSSVSLRLLENVLLSHRHDLKRVIAYIVRTIRRITGWGECTVDMTDLRMADDIQRMQLAVQLNQARQLSDQDLIAEFGWDVFEQWEKIKKESALRNEIAAADMISNATAQGESGIINSKYQALAQIANQVAINQGGPELSTSLPTFQRDAQRLNDLLQWMQLRLTYDKMTGNVPPPPPDPSQGGGGEGGEGQPPPQGGGSAPPPAEAPGGDPETQSANQSPAEPASVQASQAANPFFESAKGPDPERVLKLWATKLANMEDPQEKAAIIADIQKRSPILHRKLIQYLSAIPKGGTASDAANMMAPTPENRPPRRSGGV